MRPGAFKNIDSKSRVAACVAPVVVTCEGADESRGHRRDRRCASSFASPPSCQNAVYGYPYYGYGYGYPAYGYGYGYAPAYATYGYGYPAYGYGTGYYGGYRYAYHPVIRRHIYAYHPFRRHWRY